MYRPGLARIPAGSTGHAPPADGSLSKEKVLQSAGLARGEESSHQLSLPLHSLIVGQGGRCVHRLDTRNWCYGSTGSPAHPLHHFLKQNSHIRRAQTRICAYTTCIQRLICRGEKKRKEKKKEKERQKGRCDPSRMIACFQLRHTSDS